jgi:predicted patatin/cPLA2 family phospholipase
MKNVALVLEGGSLRSLYTSGVLDVFMENNIEFPCVIGVSAGAMNAGNYIAKHIGRSAKINLMHSNDSNYFGLKQLLFKGSVFNFDYLFNTVRDFYPYDETAINNPNQRFLIGATNCDTGAPVYFERYDYKSMTHALQASASIPLLCKTVSIDDMNCVDGGVADPIPVKKAFDEGYEKVVLVLTRDLEFRMNAHSKSTKFLCKRKYKKYPRLIESLESRPQRYNDLLDEIKKLEDENKIFVIRPCKEIAIRKIEKDVRALLDLYFRGREDTLRILPQMFEYINK